MAPLDWGVRGVLVSALLKLPKNFQGRMIGHVFTVHDAEKEDIWTFFGTIFFGSSGDNFFWLKRRTYPPKGGRMVSLE